MKFFQKLFRKELTPIEQLAEYEAEIAYYQSVIQTQTDYAEELKASVETYCVKGYDSELQSYLDRLNACNRKIDDAQSNIKYYEVLAEHLKKELEKNI